MRNRMFEIVVFLIDYMQGDAGRLGDTDELWAALEAQGYSEEEITTAYSWLLRRVENVPRRYFSNFPTMHSSQRILTADERSRLTTDAYGFLVRLDDLGVIDDEQMEAVLDRVWMIMPRPVTVEQVKLIASSVIFSELDEDEALTLFDTEADFARYAN